MDQHHAVKITQNDERTSHRFGDFSCLLFKYFFYSHVIFYPKKRRQCFNSANIFVIHQKKKRTCLQVKNVLRTRWYSFTMQRKNVKSIIQSQSTEHTSHPGFGARTAATIELAFPYKSNQSK